MSKEEKELIENEVEETQETAAEPADDKEALLSKKRKAKKDAEEKAALAAKEAEEAAEETAKKAAEKPKAKKAAPKKAAKKEEAPKEEPKTEEQPQEEVKSRKDETPQKRWYIVHTYSGHEHKVKANLEKRIEYMNMSDKIFRVEVPQKTVTHVKDGRKQDREEKIFPGYVLVEMIMDDDSWYVVRHTASVTKFVGAKRPIPAKDAEIKRILHRSQAQTTKIVLDVKVGDKIRIVSGPFADFIGDITEVYPDKSKLRAMVSIFGRETPVELEYKQIQKV